MSGETSQLLTTLAAQVQARDANGEFQTIQRLGVARLFERGMVLEALSVGGIELVAFLAALGTEHSPAPARFQKILQVCQAAQDVAATDAAGERQLKAGLLSEIIKAFDTEAVGENRKRADNRLLILDNIFPVLAAGFRIAEYNACLERYSQAEVHSTGTAFHYAQETRPFPAVLQDYRGAYPALASRVHAFNQQKLPDARLIYTIFVNNAHKFLPIAEARGTPLVFTLYPGGGFQFDDPTSDMKLRRVFASPCFKRVIVTQTATHRYLLAKKLCAPDKISYIFGGVLPAHEAAAAGPKQHYGVDKLPLDICFAANKYMPGGVDKGFDVFLDLARRLATEFPAARFHVAGTMAATDGDLSGLKDRISFQGCLTTDALHRFFYGMDLIVSPNIPFKLKPGAFDGFPTGTCVEAGLCGVAVFCTDELKLNTAFKAGEEIVVLSRNADEIFATVAGYCRAPERLQRLATQGASAFRRVFSLTDQMAPRFAVLDEFLAA